MACRIAEASALTAPVVWPSVSSPGLLTSSPCPETALKPKEEIADQQALREAERMRQRELAQCRQIAFEEGVKKGREDASSEVKAATDRLAQILNDLATAKRRARNESESEMVKLSLAIAKRVLHRELSMDPESIQGLVHAALQKLGNREIASVRVYPGAADSVRLALEKSEARPAITVIPDGKMRVGDIVFETTLGELDASIDTQLKEIDRGFTDRLGL